MVASPAPKASTPLRQLSTNVPIAASRGTAQPSILDWKLGDSPGQKKGQQYEFDLQPSPNIKQPAAAPAQQTAHNNSSNTSSNSFTHLQQRRGDKERGSMGCTGLQDDLQELRQQFDILNNQLQQLPVSNARRDSLLGQGALAKHSAALPSPAATPSRQGAAAAGSQAAERPPLPTPSKASGLTVPPSPLRPKQAVTAAPAATATTNTPTRASRAPQPAHPMPSLLAQHTAAPSSTAFPSAPKPHLPPSGPPSSTQHQPQQQPPKQQPQALQQLQHQQLQRWNSNSTTAASVSGLSSSNASNNSLPATTTNTAAAAIQNSVLAPSLPASVFSASAADLAARATSMQDCPLDGRDGRTERLFHFPASVPFDSKTWKAASQVFEDPELTTSCDEGLNKQLKRTKDGATEQSRIQELAGLVKVLRKNVRELGSRTSTYVEQCIKLERELVQQIETVQLSSECAIKTLEAELAGTKSSLAGFEASFKADKASWGAELEGSKYEGSRLKRELERVTEERDRAREEGKQAQQLKQQLEVELKELRKTASQQKREVAVSQSEAVRQINDEKLGAERREATLKDDNARLAQRLEAASACVEALQRELAILQQMHDKAKDGLQTKTGAEEVAVQRAAQLQSELSSCQTLVSALEGEVAALQQQLSAANTRTHQLEADLSAARADLMGVQHQLETVSAEMQADKAAWAEERTQLQADLDNTASRETSLVDEKAALKAALSAAISQKEEAEMAVAQGARELAALSNECINLKHQVDFVTGQQVAADERAAHSDAALATSRAELSRIQQEVGGKDERLAVLEGEFAALKEVLGDAGGQRDVVQSLLSRISSLQTAVATADNTRRKMHNELVSIRGNIRVYCRVKPHPTPVMRCLPDQIGVSIGVDGKEHGFGYDRVFNPTEGQEEVFSAVSELVQSALDGYHVCLFSYGQTGAGKTYTMQGGHSPEQRGIIPRSVEKILDTAHKLREQEWEYDMQGSFVEVYNNSLRDLLGGPNAPYISDQSAIKHDSNGGHTHVAGVSRVAVPDMEAADALIRRASSNRACESTAMNSESSRSHVVFMLYIHGVHPPSGTDLQGCLCLVDLAGSERLDRSQAEDARKKEACAINQSLSALGDIFASLASKNAHVPYRNSKLTYLLQPCLGGQGKTLMFVNINPEPASAHESLCSLKFAAKVNGCETGAKGGAKRYTSGGSGLLPSQMMGNNGEPKRFSLPGPPKAAMSGSGAITPRGGLGGSDFGAGSGPKRQSLYAPSGSGNSFTGGAKRPPPGGGCPPNAAKRARH